MFCDMVDNAYNPVVPKKINVKAAVKKSAKAVEVPHDKVVDAAKKKVAAMTPFKQPRPATKIIKDDDQTPKRGRKRVAQVLEEDVVLSGKRMINPSFALVSPYYERKTMYTKPLSEAEKKIVEYIWSYKCPEGDIIFTGKGLQIECIWFLSLYPEIQLSSNIIDLWSIILNDEEKYRGKHSVTKNIYSSTRMLDLKCNALGCMKKYRHEIEPIMLDRYMSFKNKTIGYVDQYAILQIISFIHYLECIKHPKVDAFFSAIPKILRMPWRTTYNAVDCGLFVMRHMEMYNGSGIWLNNMKNEKAGQKSQIKFLRAKYLEKILLLPYNISKKELLKEANEEWKKQQKKSKTVTNMDVKVNKNLMKKFNETLQKAYSA
ncbi:ulp1 protease family, C-terminal catalytic domain-containing protein [Tanacetum coccineum]